MVVAHSPFPPSFDDNPWSYGAALFAGVLISALSLAHLLHYWSDARGRRRLSRPIPLPLAATAPLRLHRLMVGGLFATLLMRAFPDCLVMLAWGEATDRTMTILFAIDRYFDALALVPLLVSSFIAAWTHQAISQRLIDKTATRLDFPSWRLIFDRMHDRMKIAGLALLIAIGVTFAKAGILP